MHKCVLVLPLVVDGDCPFALLGCSLRTDGQKAVNRLVSSTGNVAACCEGVVGVRCDIVTKDALTALPVFRRDSRLAQYV